MRIAVFVKGTVFHSQHGGLETQNQALCEGFVNKGHSVHIFSPKKDFLEFTKIYKNIDYHFVESKFKMGWLLGFFGFLDKNNWVNRSYAEFVKIDQTAHFDLVISQSTAGIGIIKNASKHTFKTLMIAHGSILSEYKTFLKEVNILDPKQDVLLVKNTAFALKNFFTRQRECVLNATKVITVSNFVKKALIEETFAPEEKFVVINNGIQNPDFDQNSKKYGKTLFFAGRLEKSKGVDILLQAVKSVFSTHTDANLVIAGKGPEEQDLKELAKSLGIAQNTHFAGWTEKEDLAKLYSNASVFVLPTIRIEGFPMTLVEASAYGLALMASDVGGNSDAVQNGDNGYLLEAGNVQQLANALNNLLNNPEQVKLFGTASRKSFEHNFTQDIMIDKYNSVIQSL